MTSHADPQPIDPRAGSSHASREPSWLGIKLGESNWLLDPADVAEAIPPPELAPIPFTQHWFAGVACVRGTPLGVVDLQAFLTGTPVESSGLARLVIVAERHRINSALLVTRVLGLEPLARFVREPDASSLPAWIEAHYRDREGARWAALGMQGLLTHPSFLRIELPA